MRDLIARLRSLLTTGLPMEDLYTISTYYAPSHSYPQGRTFYIEQVRGYRTAHARAFCLNGQRTTTSYAYIVTRSR